MMKNNRIYSTGLTPLPSYYNGREYRSRLEARWAIYFDLIGFPTDYYEHEGFRLSTGNYLPDFYDPRGKGTFVEIKPTKQECDKISDTLKDLSIKTGSFVVPVYGNPRPGEFSFYLNGEKMEWASFTYHGYATKKWEEPHFQYEHYAHCDDTWWCEESEQASRIAVNAKFQNGQHIKPCNYS